MTLNKKEIELTKKEKWINQREALLVRKENQLLELTKNLSENFISTFSPLKSKS